MLEEQLKKNTDAIIALTEAVLQLAKLQAPTTKESAPEKPAKKDKPAKAEKSAKKEEAPADTGDDLLGGDEEAEASEPEVTYEDLRAMAQKAIAAEKVDGLRKIVKEELKCNSLSDLDEAQYAKAHKLLTKLLA